MLLGLVPVLADHSAPAPQLGGVVFCLEPSSVQLETEAFTLPQAEAQNLRQKVFEQLKVQLETQNILYSSDCTRSQNYILLSLYARFLDPQTYIGFPENSYTYVTSAQVGKFVVDADAQMVLPESSYSASASDIFQAGTPTELETILVALGSVEGEALTRTWLEANTAAWRSYLLFAAFGLSLIALRALTTLVR